mmetsp:Transcript_9733/g.21017  ORF Transcript_9733/g.21017 Transcript_9733/m.21017 type:complete len:393 (+) Transcript_9733:178-1356(+)
MTANAPSNKDKNAENSWKPGFSGFSGGAISTVLLMPLDNIKVRLQVNEGASTNLTSSPPTAIEAKATATSKYATSNNTGSRIKEQQKPRTRLGAMRMLRGVIKYEGVRGLYQGLAPAVVGSAVSWGGFFYVYEAMKQQLRYVKSMKNADIAYYTAGNNITAIRRDQPQQQLATLNSWDNFILGTASGVVMVFVTNPIWLIKLRLQLQMKRTSEHLHLNNVTRYDGFWDAFRKIVRSDGILGLYRGTGPALILTSHGGVQFVVYEFLRKHFHYVKAQRSTESSSVMKRFENSLGYLTIGAISKMAASTTTYPMQVVKSRIQQPSSSIELTNTGDVRVVKRNYGGLIATIQKMWRQEGIAGFFKGAIPNAVRVAPSAAVTFFVYESAMDILQDV